MKIGYFTQFPFTNENDGIEISSAGGVGVVAYTLATQMAKRGHDVTVFTPSIHSADKVEYYEKSKIRVYRFSKTFTIGTAPISLKLLLKPLFMKEKFDIVHAHLGNLPAPLAAYWYAKKHKIPFIITHHGDWIGGFGGLLRRLGVFLYNYYLADKLLSYADSIIALSRYHVNESELLKKYRSKIKIIPNGIDPEKFKIYFSKEECRKKLNLPIDKRILLFVGTLTPRKGPHILIKAMKIVVDEIPNAYLALVGKGTMKQDLERMTVQLKLKKNVYFAGFIQEELKPLFYHSADVFVLPSFKEAFPLTLLEASICKLPLVVSDLECFRGIVDHQKNGLFTKSGDEQDLAEKIIYILQNENIRKKMGNIAMEKAKQFSWEEIAKEVEKLYYNLLSNNTKDNVKNIAGKWG